MPLTGVIPYGVGKRRCTLMNMHLTKILEHSFFWRESFKITEYKKTILLNQNDYVQ